MRNVQVKPLEWAKHPTADMWRVDTLIGTYKVFGVFGSPSWDFDGYADQTSKVSESIEAAQSAAQADYEQRIRSALVPAPAVPDDVAKIVAELRVIGCHENGDARCTCGIGMDAADALEAQAAELARLTEANDTLGGHLATALSKLLAAEAAAQPAPELCDVCGGHGMAGHPDSGAICLRCNGSGGIKPAPDAVAEVRIADDDSLASRISELGWQIHNLGCEYQNDEKLLGRLQDLRGMAWEIADIAREPRT